MSSNNQRHQFSHLGFIMAAAGSAVGLGNIWSFPSQVAKNGGAAFVLMYLFFTVCIVYPALLAELTVGRYTRSNPVNVFHKIKGGERFAGVGFLGLICVGLILSFYSIVGGWLIAYFFKSILLIFGFHDWATALHQQSLSSNVIFTTLFFLMTIGIVIGGLQNGIEAWAKVLMPLLVVLLIVLIGYVMTLTGAWEGVRRYLVPDFTKVFEVKLMISAMGQAFFSASLGGGAMLVYGSYLSKEQSLPAVGFYVLLFDFSIAFLAGLLMMPAMYAAAARGIPIFDEKGELLQGGGIAFDILPALFGDMGIGGHLAMVSFFLFMVIAALTSSISMLEVQVSYLTDNQWTTREKGSWLVGGLLWSTSLLLIVNFETLFGLVITITTEYLQPALAIAYCLLLGWILEKGKLQQELKAGSPKGAYEKLFDVLPVFFKYIIPFAVGIVWIRGMIG